MLERIFKSIQFVLLRNVCLVGRVNRAAIQKACQPRYHRNVFKLNKQHERFCSNNRLIELNVK